MLLHDVVASCLPFDIIFIIFEAYCVFVHFYVNFCFCRIHDFCKAALTEACLVHALIRARVL